MADMFSPKKRSAIMSAVKSRANAATEIRLAKLFRQEGVTGWRRHPKIEGKPDFAFLKARLAVFVDGCFWHGCPKHGQIPATNSEFWREKIRRNVARDRKVGRLLRAKKWKIVRIWQHDLKSPAKVVSKIRAELLR